jgi:hypothetical protein
MSLAETVHRAFELAKQGPEPFSTLLSKVAVIYGSVDAWTFDDVLQAVASEGEGGAVRTALRTPLARWDNEEAPSWAGGTSRGTSERRSRIYDGLGLSVGDRTVLSDRVPFFPANPPVVIKADRWEPWYGDDRKIGHTFYWDAFCRQLRDKAGWHEESVLSLDESTDAVVARLADPLSATAYQSKGLVVGYVQSGKTANITGVVAKAADAGYRLVIVLAGNLKLLRDQTQRRLDRELLGIEQLEDEYEDDAELASFLTHGGKPSALGAFDWTRLTGREREYRKLSGGAIESLKFSRRSPSHPINHPDNLYHLPAKLLVVKKQANVLDRLADDLARINAGRELGEVPALVIDDESDQASVNTMKPRDDEDSVDPGEQRERTRINGAIVGLLEALPRAQYIGYTATPYANVFIDPSDAENIFPRDFMVSLPRPVGYLGVSDFHDLQGPPAGVEANPFLSNERAFVRAVYGDDADASNLQQAVDSFLIAGAIKLFRARADISLAQRHHTMMIHTSRLTPDHQEQLRKVQEQLTTGGYRTGTASGRLRALFDEDFRPIAVARAPQLPVPASFREIEDDLGEVLTRLYRGGNPALLVNSTAEADQLAFDTEPVWKIIVGGAKLSRGFTVEGLTTSYFRRRSPTADTLMQMGRWCGFRRGYADLVRLFIGRREPHGREVIDVYEAFEAICRDEEDFREELARYALVDGDQHPITPMDIPPLVASRLEWIKPASRNKMFNARITFRNYGGRTVEHRRVAQTAPQKRDNEALIVSLLQAGPVVPHALGTTSRMLTAYGGFRSHGDVRAMLDAYTFAGGSDDFRQELEFLDGAYGAPGIDDWVVLLPQLKRPSDRTWRFAGQDLSVHRRGYWRDTKPLASAFTGPEDRTIAEAISCTREIADPTPELAALRAARRAVLLVYPITHEGEDRESEWLPTMGLAIQFPPNDIPQKIGFAVRSPRHADDPVINVSESA